MDFEEDLTEMGFMGGESDAAFKKRVDLRNSYVATCNKGKKEFHDEIVNTTNTLKRLGSANVK